MRDSKGNPLDLTAYNTAPAGVVAYAVNVFCPLDPVIPITATIIAPAQGQLSLLLPKAISTEPNIYKVEAWAASDKGDVLATAVYKEDFLLSVEASLLARANNPNMSLGPITISEVRAQLRDYPELNEYWQQHEYSVEEIVRSIILPIYTFNETPPPVRQYSGANFPYRSQWLDGTVANLMRTASIWLLRNSRTLKYGDGTTESDKDKFDIYYKIAESKWQAYRQFCKDQKVAINLRTPAGIH
jgi:hypothetical protein